MKYQITTDKEVITIDARLNKWGEIYCHDSLIGLDSMIHVKEKGPTLLQRLFQWSKRLNGKLSIVDLGDGNKGNRLAVRPSTRREKRGFY